MGVLLVAVGLVAPVAGPAAATPSPVTARLQHLVVSGVDPGAAGVLRRAEPTALPQALTAEREVSPFRVIGLSWAGSAVVEAKVRIRTSGSWSEWITLPESDGAPDPSAPESTRMRSSTAPFVVGSSDGVQVRIDRRSPHSADLRLTLVDPGTSDADDLPIDVGTLPSASAAGTAPAYYTRAQWGADESLRRADPYYGDVRAVVIHHTAGTNSYAAAEVPAIIRGIYAYHVKVQGWNDIGYNALVDRFGRLWEGRAGGLNKPVSAAHTYGFNGVTAGVSGIGDFSTVTPPQALLDGYTRYAAWKLSLHHLDPATSVSLTRSDGAVVTTVSRVPGHRDLYATSCPGDRDYAQLPSLRTRIKTAQGTEFYDPAVTPKEGVTGSFQATVSARLSTAASWRLTVTQSCLGQVRVLTGSAGTGAFTAMWDGRFADGTAAPVGTYQLTLTASSGTSASEIATPWESSVQVLGVSGSEPRACPPRYGGSDRYGVALAVATATDPYAEHVVLASGVENARADALSAGPLARAQGGVMMLTSPSALPAAVAQDLARRGVTKVSIVGGPGSVSDDVVAQLKGLGISAVVRYGGGDRYEVAASVARAIGARGSTVLVTSGEDAALADGLGLAGPAAALGYPLVLVRADQVPTATADALAELAPSSSVVAGGSATVSDAVLDLLPLPIRLGGASRYDVAANVARWADGQYDPPVAVVSSGQTSALSDALSAGQLGLPLLYVTSLALPTSSADALGSLASADEVLVVGGPASVPDRVAGQARSAVMR